MGLYEQILQARMDMTEWVIHFTRAQGSTSARDSLLAIAKQGVLRPGWSERSQRRTIYGPRPCVCFTEQPLWAFSQYVRVRGGSFLSGYGVLIHKGDLFADGGRPALYGGDHIWEISSGEDGFVAGYRMMRGLPPEEQYRYVAFNPNARVDWTHEREWRWPQGAREPVPESALPFEVGSFRLAGSMVAGRDGMSRGRAHLLVERDDDIPWIQAQLASLATNATADDWRHSSRWLRRLGSSVGVFSLETVQRMVTGSGPTGGFYARLETWPRSVQVAVAGGAAIGAPFRLASDILGP